MSELCPDCLGSGGCIDCPECQCTVDDECPTCSGTGELLDKEKEDERYRAFIGGLRKALGFDWLPDHKEH